MKKIRLLAPLALVLCSSLSFAQTCATPTALTSNATAITGNSCAAPTGTGDVSLGNVCDNAQNTGPVAVFSWTFGGSGTPSGNITVTPTGWDTAIFVGNGATCAAATGGFCNSKVDTAGNGAESLALAGLNSSGTTYYLFITSLAAANTCGAYNIATGALPVKLESFKVN
jgi:hypothetical protein